MVIRLVVKVGDRVGDKVGEKVVVRSKRNHPGSQGDLPTKIIATRHLFLTKRIDIVFSYILLTVMVGLSSICI